MENIENTKTEYYNAKPSKIGNIGADIDIALFRYRHNDIAECARLCLADKEIMRGVRDRIRAIWGDDAIDVFDSRIEHSRNSKNKNKEGLRW